MSDVKVSWLELDTAATPADVRVSWIAFDTAATPVDVKVSWVAFDTAATPCDVRVSWVCFDTNAATNGYLAAEIEAVKAIEQAQKTSRRARKRLREKLITVEPAETVDIDWLSELVRHFQIQADLAQLLAQQDYERVLQILAQAREMLEEEDLEILLMA